MITARIYLPSPLLPPHARTSQAPSTTHLYLLLKSQGYKTNTIIFMPSSAFNWGAIEEAIEMNEVVPGKGSKMVFMPVARDVIQDMKSNKRIAMAALRQDCQEVLKQVNRQYQSAARSVADSVTLSVKETAFNKLIIKRHFFAFMLGWIEMSRVKQGISGISESLSSNWILVPIESDCHVDVDDADWVMVGKADLV
ncbi:hypothetical protein QC761_508076 [Podospora bellae-mahoneyi]|uniref:Uncharacterized protein n=1 Tax=Podospora bellae-mahoneyi TaxID=2093777 RepID=A0ABR0FGW9_9PEZI|nr:hypothetical protein QC761_508076 [Podospora bellae-mahoneyi]